MKNDLSAQFLLGFLTAFANAILGLAINGQVNWLLVALTFFISFAVLFVYQGSTIGLRFYREFKIREGELLHSGGGIEKTESWEFDHTQANEKNGFYGPYIPLLAGKYRAVYRLKIDGVTKSEDIVCELDVLVNHTRFLAVRSIAAKDFHKSDSWQDFIVDFDLINDENKVEFRFRLKNTSKLQKRLSFDKVVVYRRLI